MGVVHDEISLVEDVVHVELHAPAHLALEDRERVAELEIEHVLVRRGDGGHMVVRPFQVSVYGSDREIRGLLRRTRVHFAQLHLTHDMVDSSAVDHNNERVGAAAVDLVVEQLNGNHFGIPENPKTVLIKGRWVPGKTAPGR